MKGKEERCENRQEGCEDLPGNHRDHDYDIYIHARRPPCGLKHTPPYHIKVNSGIDEQQEEVLVVPEADTICHPRAMVVHPQNALVANAAMMATVWLVFQAPFTMPPLSSTFRLHRVQASPTRKQFLRFHR
jgi:hypothetical protein